MTTSHEFWERLKTVATFLAALVALFGVASGFWPEIKSATLAVAGLFVQGPPWLKYVLLLSLVPVSVLLYLRLRRPTQTLFSVLDCDLSLTIHDAAAKRTTIRESTYIVAQLDGADAFKHRQWSSGGTEEPKIWTEGYRSAVKSLGIEEGLTCFAHEFIPPLRKGHKLWQHYECIISDTFPNSKEYFDHAPPYGEKKLCMKVVFPPDRKPSRVRALWMLGDGLREQGDLPLTQDKDGKPCVVWNAGRSSAGYKYRIEWEW